MRSCLKVNRFFYGWSYVLKKKFCVKILSRFLFENSVLHVGFCGFRGKIFIKEVLFLFQSRIGFQNFGWNLILFAFLFDIWFFVFFGDDYWLLRLACLLYFGVWVCSHDFSF